MTRMHIIQSWLWEVSRALTYKLIFILYCTFLSSTDDECKGTVLKFTSNITYLITSTKLSFHIDPADVRQEALRVLSIMLILLSTAYLVLETFQMFRRGWKYFLAFDNYFQICVFSFTIIFVFGFFNDCWCATPWQWQIGALAVFLAWFNVIILLKDMPWAGIPINMLFNIIWTFLKLIFMPILLIIAFSIPFYMLFVRNFAGVEVCFEYIPCMTT